MSESPQKQILVVDDDAMNREILEAFLTSEDYAVTLAHNGETALRMANHLQPDLVILDVKMPDMSGYEVCTRLKHEPQTRSIPVMMVTGFDATEDREQAFRAGADAFFPRPFAGDDLIAQVKQLLRE